jgi:hypothetical protein
LSARSTSAVTIITVPKIVRKVFEGRWRFTDAPRVMPTIEPSKKTPPTTNLSGLRLARFATNPEADMSAIETSEVAIALSIEIPVTMRRAGTRRNPPPTPKIPDG